MIMNSTNKEFIFVFLLVILNLCLFAKSRDICQNCFCDDIEPFLIKCNLQNEEMLPNKDDWSETITTNENLENLSIQLNYEDNQLKIVQQFPVTLNIQILKLGSNQIEKIEEYAFQKLKNLTEIDLSHNKLTVDSLPSKAFAGNENVDDEYLPLARMLHLNLSYNSIRSLDKDIFDHLPNLVSLDLSNNPLKTLGLEIQTAIIYLKSLESLNLGYTNLRKIPDGLIHGLQHLTHLDLSYNELSIVPDEISYGTNIKVLVLDGNKFETLDKSSFQGLISLESLYISSMNTLKSIQARTFSPLKNLTKLECHHNRKLENISQAAFLGMVEYDNDWALRELYLSDNRLAHIDHELANWKKVEKIDLQNNPFVCDCKIEFLTTALVDQIERECPEFAYELTCASPPSKKGISLIALSVEPSRFNRCEHGANFMDKEDEQLRVQESSYQSVGLTFLIIGVILIIIGLSILGVLIVKRRAIASALIARHQIRYERADADEFEVGSQKRTSHDTNPFAEHA